MPRPIKEGLDYFPLDCDFDDKVSLYLIEHEAVGLAVLITLWQLIYKHGFYIGYKVDTRLLIKQRINLSLDKIDSCINSLLVRDIFSQSLFSQYSILTSRSIQKRFFEASTRKKEIHAIKEYLLIDVSAYNNLVITNINPINDDIYPQSKVKEIKVKEIKKEEIKEKQKSVCNIVDNLTQKELSDFIYHKYSDFTPLKKPNFDSHIKPILSLFNHIPEPLSANDILICISQGFSKIPTGKKVRIDYLLSNINNLIISRQEHFLNKQKQLDNQVSMHSYSTQSLSSVLDSF